MKNEKWVLKQRPIGKPNIESDFEKVSEETSEDNTEETTESKQTEQKVD